MARYGVHLAVDRLVAQREGVISPGRTYGQFVEALSPLNLGERVTHVHNLFGHARALPKASLMARATLAQ